MHQLVEVLQEKTISSGLFVEASHQLDGRQEMVPRSLDRLPIAVFPSAAPKLIPFTDFVIVQNKGLDLALHSDTSEVNRCS